MTPTRDQIQRAADAYLDAARKRQARDGVRRYLAHWARERFLEDAAIRGSRAVMPLLERDGARLEEICSQGDRFLDALTG